MTFKKWSLALIAVALVAPVSASALGISIVNTTTSSGGTALQDGDTITFDLLLENATNEQIVGLDLGAWGYDNGADGSQLNDNLVFTSATTSTSVFNTTFFAGLPVADGLAAATPVTEFGNPIVGIERRVVLFGGITTGAPATGDGTFDNEAGGTGQTGPGAGVHVQVTFTAQSLGADAANPSSVTINFGNGAFGLGVAGPGGQLAAFTDSATVTIVPEPGTALLMGLGLAGLAGIRRR